MLLRVSFTTVQFLNARGGTVDFVNYLAYYFIWKSKNFCYVDSS